MDHELISLYTILLKLKRKVRFIHMLPMYYEIGFTGDIVRLYDPRGKIRWIDTVFIRHYLYDRTQ